MEEAALLELALLRKQKRRVFADNDMHIHTTAISGQEASL